MDADRTSAKKRAERRRSDGGQYVATLYPLAQRLDGRRRRGKMLLLRRENSGGESAGNVSVVRERDYPGAEYGGNGRRRKWKD